MEEHEVRGLKVNLYNFKQPERLSELQLPFKLLLLQEVRCATLRTQHFHTFTRFQNQPV